MAEDQSQEQKEKPKKPLNIALIMKIVFLVVNFGVMGTGGYLVYASTIGWHPPSLVEEDLRTQEEKEIEAKRDLAPFIYTMDKFTVNLEGEPRRSIRIEVNLEMLGQEGFEEVINVENRAKARDRVVRILNERTFFDLESIQGKLFLKDRIAMEVNDILKEGVVKDVYFSEFVVQATTQ